VTADPSWQRTIDGSSSIGSDLAVINCSLTSPDYYAELFTYLFNYLLQYVEMTSNWAPPAQTYCDYSATRWTTGWRHI